MKTVFTTSWDDGHPLDLRVAELLAKFGLPGTFYIPAGAERDVMDGVRMRELAKSFEIGAHTMTHGNLLTMPVAAARSEMAESKQFVEDATGRACTIFAPPGGRFRREHLHLAAGVGFRGVRTVELMSLARPAVHGKVALMPTTLQVFRHSAAHYARNAAKRWRPENMITYFAHVRGADLPRAAEALVAEAIRQGGVFHLWGHSWEIEEYELWGALERILQVMREERGRCRRATNQNLCEEVLRDESIAGTVADPELS